MNDFNKFFLANTNFPILNKQEMDEIEKMIMIENGGNKELEENYLNDLNGYNNDIEMYFMTSNNKNFDLNNDNYLLKLKKEEETINNLNKIQKNNSINNLKSELKNGYQNMTYIKELFEATSFTKNMNDKNKTEISPINSTKNISLVCDDPEYTFISPMSSRKFSGDLNLLNTFSKRKSKKKDSIFKTEKIRKFSSKSNDCTSQTEIEFLDDMTLNEIDKKKIIQNRNRESAKKCRNKKKIYVKLLEKVLKDTLKELENQKMKNNNSFKIENSIEKVKLKKNNLTD